MALGVVLEERGHPKKAEKVYKDYINDNPQAADILARLVELLFTQEKFDEVVDYAERLSDLDPSDLNLRVKLGILYTDTQRFDKAVKTFEDLLEFSPGNDKLLYYLGAIHQETKEFESALEAYSQIPTQSALYHDSALQMAHILSAMALISEEKEKRFLSYIDKKSIADKIEILNKFLTTFDIDIKDLDNLHYNGGVMYFNFVLFTTKNLDY